MGRVCVRSRTWRSFFGFVSKESGLDERLLLNSRVRRDSRDTFAYNRYLYSTTSISSSFAESAGLWRDSWRGSGSLGHLAYMVFEASMEAIRMQSLTAGRDVCSNGYLEAEKRVRCSDEKEAGMTGSDGRCEGGIGLFARRTWT